MKPIGHEKDIPCNQYHRINGKIPTVNGEIHEVQNPDLIGKFCDCKKCYFTEQMCACPGDNHWQIVWQPNPNY